MIPKVNSCLEAVANGVKRAHIIDGKERHSILIELFTDKGIGTMVINS
jgi:acetylglutamate kinase